MPFGFPDTFEAEPIKPKGEPPWVVDKSAVWPVSDEKKLFAQELSKNNKNAFEAACKVFPKDANKALSVSKTWVNDPQVLQEISKIEKIIEDEPNLLDKSQLAGKLLDFYEEKIYVAGRVHYISEGKDRLKALELYSKIMGFHDDGAKQTNNYTNNEMKIVLVKPEVKEPEIKPKHIEHIINETTEPIPFNIKLVSVK